jgi:HEAT repeat protein
MLSDKSSETRIKAAEGLGRIGGLRSVLILRRGLSDKTVEVRVAVVEALGFVGGGA